MSSNHYDVLVVGCGIVGCAVAREFTLAGCRVGIVEKKSDPVSEASSGNTGHIASFFYYTETRTPIEFKMTRRARNLNREWLAAQKNVTSCKKGLLLPAFTKEELEIRLVTPEEVQQLEPNLNKTSRRLVGGLFSPDEYLVDTWLLAISYLYSALQNGCDLHLNCEVVDCRYSGGQWAVEARSSSSQQTSRFTAGVVINCAGNYSDAMHEILSGERGSDSFRITPGKGEFLVFESVSSEPTDSPHVRNMVAPIPSKTTAGVYVFTSLYGNVVVGPTNEYQTSKTDRSCSAETQRKLREHAVDLFPALKERATLKSFSGLRPACADQERHYDYQVKFDLQERWVTLGGIRSTGASTCTALAEMVAERILPANRKIKRLHDSVMPKPINLGNGFVEIGDYKFKPTHPLTQTGIDGRASKEIIVVDDI